MKFLADENFPAPALTALRALGHDLLSIAEAHAGLKDDEVAAICESESRILLTFDKDFGELIFRRGLSVGSSVVLFRTNPDAGTLVQAVQSLINQQILTTGVFCVVTDDRIRVRPLDRR